MKVLTIVGARPQFIKAAVVSAALAEAGVEEQLVHTGQHHDAAMSAVFFDELGLKPPCVNLSISGLSHGAMTGRMLETLETVIREARVKHVMVYGDTNSTLAGALAAVKLGALVSHVEAGMRSFSTASPEEINRVIVDHISKTLFVTGDGPRRLLAAEGITRGVRVVGDVMLDALQRFRAAAQQTNAHEALGLKRGAYALATVHRAENTEDASKLGRIMSALETVAQRLPVLLPLHPRTRRALASLGVAPPSFVRLVEPVSYLEMIELEGAAAVILTDSGGVQKEAFFQRVPCVTLRAETEWSETVELGWNVLTSDDTEAITTAVDRFISHPPTSPTPPIYGDGRSGERIAEFFRRV